MKSTTRSNPLTVDRRQTRHVDVCPLLVLTQFAPADAGQDVATEEPKKVARIGQTLRLNPEAWQEIKELSVRLSRDRRQPVRQHELLIEAVNDLLRKYGRPTLAE